MANIEYIKADEGTLQIVETPDVKATTKTVRLDELIEQEQKLVNRLKDVREKIKKCQELGIKTRAEIMAEEDAHKRAELAK